MRKVFLGLFLSVLSVPAQAEEKIIVTYTVRPPFFVENGGKLSGSFYDRYKSIFEKAGVPYEFQSLPQARGLATLDKSKMCITSIFKTADREKLGVYTLPATKDDPLVISYKIGNKSVEKYNTVIDLIKSDSVFITKVGASSGEWYDAAVKKYKGFDNLTQEKQKPINSIRTTSVDREAILLQVAYDRGDYAIMNRDEAQYILDKNEVLKKSIGFKQMSDSPAGEYRYLLCSNSVDKSVIDKLNNAIKK